MQELKRTRTSFFDRNRFFILLTGIMLGGVLIGSLAFCSMNDTTAGRISFIAKGFIETRAKLSLSAIFVNTFLSSSGFLLLIFILGFSAVTQPIEILIPFFKGLGLGASLAQIYADSGVKGFLIILLLIVPCAIINSFGIIIAVREAIRFSNIFTSKAISSENGGGMKSITKLYCIKFLVIEVIMMIGAAVDCICSFMFAGVLLG